MNWFRKVLGGKSDAAPPTPAAPDPEAALFAPVDALDAEANRAMAEGRPADALTAMNAAIASLHEALKGRTDQPGRERWLSELYGKQGSIKVALGDLDGAAQCMLDSCVTVRALSDRYPIDPELKSEVGIALQKVARVLMLQGRHGNALKFIQDASAIFAALAKEWNGEPKFRQYFAACTELLAECFTALGQPELAAELKRNAAV
jgi:tetratricopeptide (TPR) repeat protein